MTHDTSFVTLFSAALNWSKCKKTIKSISKSIKQKEYWRIFIDVHYDNSCLTSWFSMNRSFLKKFEPNAKAIHKKNSSLFRDFSDKRVLQLCPSLCKLKRLNVNHTELISKWVVSISLWKRTLIFSWYVTKTNIIVFWEKMFSVRK